jgi:hypothetical protein
MKRVVVLVLFLLSFTQFSQSHASEVDGIFNAGLGDAGYINWNANPEANLLRVIKLSDGKILHYGSIADGVNDAYCQRYRTVAVATKTNALGQADPNFNFNGNPQGSISIDESERDIFVSAVEGSDGEIYLLGISQSITPSTQSNGVSCSFDTERVYVVKVDGSGTLNDEFGINGIRDIDITGQDGFASSISLVDNGKILVSFHEGSVFDLLSLLPNGETNTAFGNEGLVKLSKVNMRVFFAIQSDSNIVLFGDKYNEEADGSNRWAISSIDLQGNELENFKGTQNYEYSSGLKEGIHFQPQYSDPYFYLVGGVLAGSTYEISTYEIQAIRVHKNGERDSTYGGYLGNQLLGIGVTACSYCSGDYSLDEYGRVLVSIGTETFSDLGQRQSVVVRLDQDGFLDLSFGNGGKIWVNYDYQAGVIGAEANNFVIYGSQGINGSTVLLLSQFDQLPKNVNPTVSRVSSRVGEIDFALSNIDTESAYSVTANFGQVTFDTQTGIGKIYGLGDASRLVNIVIRSARSGFGEGKVRFRAQSVDSEGLRIQLAKAAEKEREAEKSAARVEILERLSGSQVIDLQTFYKASIAGVTPQNIDAIQREIAELPLDSRTDINAIIAVARKFEVVDKVASNQKIYSGMLQEIGLIPQDSKNKAALTAALRKLPASERSSYLAIKQAIDAQMTEIQTRKQRLSEVLASIAARRQG